MFSDLANKIDFDKGREVVINRFYDAFGRARKYFYDKKGESKLGVLSSPLFLWVLIAKVVSSFLFASDFLVSLFSKFINYFVSSGFSNPYDFFYGQHLLAMFPYPNVMLWFLAVPRIIFSPFLGGDYNTVSNFHIFIYRLPILLADVIIFVVLVRWLKTKPGNVMLYYWCSPVLFYINYVHGQLDVVPVMLLFVSLYFLFKEAWLVSFLFLGLAISAKTSMALVLPFMVVYLFLKKVDIRRILPLAVLPAALFLVLNANYIFSPGFVEMVLKTKEQFKIFDLNYNLGDSLVIYFVPLAYLLLFLRSLTYRTFNRDIFLMFLGFSFGILTLFIPPMQGWYYWIVPFFIYFYIKQENAPKFTFVLLNIFYFAYFLVIKSSDFFEVFQLVSGRIAAMPNLYAILNRYGLQADIVVNIVFTLLQGTLLLNILWVYKRGIESNVQYKIKYQPYLIGIAGDSGSGKNVLAGLLTDCFGEKNTLSVEGDDLHRWERGDANWSKRTHLDPLANKLHNELANAMELKQGNNIERSLYDHRVGKFTLPQKMASKRVIIFQGLHSLYLNTMRGLMDLRIFVRPSEELRLHWKVKRDMSERGHSKEKVLEQVKAREEDSQKYIHNQERHADIVVSLCNQDAISEPGNEGGVRLFLKLRFKNNINAERLVQELGKQSQLDIHHYYDEDFQFLEFYGSISREDVDWVAYNVIPELWEVSDGDPRWSGGYNGLIQLFCCYYIFYKMKLDDGSA